MQPTIADSLWQQTNKNTQEMQPTKEHPTKTINALQMHKNISVQTPNLVEKHEFVFDVVLNEEVSNDEVYHETVEPIVPIIFQHMGKLEENLKLKRLKDELREPLCWTDYLSLPFTQTNLMREDLRNFFQSSFCFPEMATVLFPSLSYTYLGEASEEFDRDDNTLTLIKPSPMPSKDIRSPLEVGSVHGGNNGVSNVDLEEDKTE
ncbi:Kinesin-like protein KIN-13B [Camellia lanceoleosa]|uniref:Kinesin-like protein KIN-13B n=1 Tax=Camellia lanceoleosa TaxID=1840588 RepID=A0ACC0GN99_9ERIC|nr:Kinesin-like protein KIN-13B [Camellia lanceoleosa]